MDGNSCNKSPTVALPVTAIGCWLTVTTGLAVSVSTRRKREPVTTMPSSVCVASPPVACCADTGAAAPADSASNNAVASLLGNGCVVVPVVRENGNGNIGMQCSCVV